MVPKHRFGNLIFENNNVIGNWKSPILFLLFHSNIYLNNKEKGVHYNQMGI